MTFPLNISNLDPDIKRLILRMEENSIEYIRQISPSWNRVVLQYRKESRNLLPLERVYLRSGHIDTDHQAYAAQDCTMKWKLFDMSRLLHMHAIVPDRSKARIGLGKWLKTHQNFADATEVICAPQKIELSTNENLKYGAKALVALLIYSLAVGLTLSVADLIFPIRVALVVTLLLFVISPFAVTFSLIHIKTSASAPDKRRLARLTRFYHTFSHIELLVLDTFSNRSDLDTTLSSLGEIRIEKIEVRVHNFDKGLQKRIIELTRKHRTRHISIATIKCAQGNLGNFLKKLVKLGATANVYESVNKNTEFYKEVLNYFHRPVEFWDKMQKDLKKEGVVLRLSTIRDDGFKEIQCASYVRARLACMPSGIIEMEESLAMIPIPSLTLEKLPPDIIRCIVRMEQDSMESMRLISHSWNAIVIEHKKDPRYFLPLERLHIHNDFDHSARVPAPQPVHNFGSPFPPMPPSTRYVQPQRDPRVEVHALVPELYAMKIGLGVWLSVTKRYPGAIEVNCMPQKFASVTKPPGKWIYVCCAITVVLFVVLSAGIAFFAVKKSVLSALIGALLPLILVGTCYGCSKCCNKKDSSDEYRSFRFRRFLSLFSQVDMLVLDNIGYPDYDIFDTVTATLGETKITRLEVKDEECDGFMLKRILTLTQTHSIHHVSIVAHKCAADNIGKFLLQMARIGVTVDISEAVAHFSRTPNYQIGVYFQKPVEFWDEMVSNLAKDGVTLQITTNQDALFNKYRCSAWVRATLSCGQTDIERGEEEAHPQRGYFRQKWMNGR